MKTILISIIFFTTLFSDSLVYVKNNSTPYCVSDNYLEFDGAYLFFLLPSSDDLSINYKDIVEIKGGFNCESNTSNPETPTNPTPDKNGLIMGMKETDFHLAMALWGVCLSFLMSIGLIISF